MALTSPRVLGLFEWSEAYLQYYNWPGDAVGDALRFWSWTVAMLALYWWLRLRSVPNAERANPR